MPDEVKELEIQEDYSLLERGENEEEDRGLLDGFSIEFYPELLLDEYQERR